MSNNSVQEMHDKYRKLEYDLPFITNYSSINKDYFDKKYPLNAYEHGINKKWTHQIVLNTAEPKPFDYPFFQLTSHKQFILDRLKTEDNLIILAHPSFVDSYEAEEMTYLGSYDLMEGITVRATSIKHWDAVLAAGRAIWVVASDDSHDTATAHVGVTWTDVNVTDQSKAGVLESLRKGRHVAQRSWYGQHTTFVKSVSVTDHVDKLKITEPVDSIVLISDNGKRVAFETDANKITYKVKAENSYIRAELFHSTEWIDYSRLYLNPVIRTTDSTVFSRPLEHHINWLQTILYIIAVLLFHAALAAIVLKW